ncbi:MFS transporter [Paraburkholderia sp. DHOC27]|uniref:MFS transporter n=1 Tax=Paraburkholderia sp. DHOC27 TaxID=2303330 RepID=UPI0015F33716|nr:MFS transporter [Paraburkholderia sp. DHOC27]
MSETSSFRIVFAAAVGNALEWYDLTIYGFLALPIARVFFPAHDAFISLLLTLGTLGASYLMRPIGAICLGAYADRHGRKAGMLLTSILMGIGALLIAVAPTYAVAGPFASLIVVCAKFLQGFSAGGEYGASVSFLVEHAKENRRGLFASFQIVGVGLAAMLASLVSVALSHFFTDSEIVAWAWRIPFIVGLLILPLGWFIRSKVEETPAFHAAVAQAELANPMRSLLGHDKMRVVSAIGLYCLAASTNYLLGVYLPTYAVRELGVPASSAFVGTLAFALVQVLLAPVIGALSDKLGRQGVIATGIALVTISVLPLFQILLHYRSPNALVACVACLGIFVTIFQGPVPAFLSELFPTPTRTTGLAAIHNLNFTIFGGFAPLLMTSLIGATSDRLVPAYYVLVTAACAACGLWSLLRQHSNNATRPVSHGRCSD